ncbi:MAG: M56 family metallopeptidase [Planctomycetota bacterium]
MIRESAAAILRWFASHTFGSLLLLSLQLALITAIAWCLSRRLSRQDASRTHGVWLAAITLSLLLLPVTVIGIGWPITLAPESSAGPRVVASMRSNVEAFEFAGTPMVTETMKASQPAAQKARTSKQPAPIVAESSPPIRENAAAFRMMRWSAPSISSLVVWGYLIGLFVCLARLVHSIMRLRLLRAKSIRVGESIQSDAEHFAGFLGLVQVPYLYRSVDVEMPMVCGMLRPVVLLPLDFETWSREERDATLLHELTHVKRKDVCFRMLAAVNHAVYWFHPVSGFLARRLSVTREWATDRDVIEVSDRIGLTPLSYAESLVSIVARCCARAQLTPAVAMAASDDLEHRLQLMMNPVKTQRRFPRLAVAVLTVAAAVSLIHFQVSDAAPQPQEKPSREDELVVEHPLKPSLATIGTEDNDLLHLVLSAPVANFKDLPEDRTTTIDVSGTVVSASGKPVPGAIVLLRDGRIRQEVYHKSFLCSDEHEQLAQMDDVIARTVSDELGRFRFDEVKLPSTRILKLYDWFGDLMVAHESLGLGFLPLQSKHKETRQEFAGLQLRLQPTSTIEGVFRSTEGEPLPNALVQIRELTGIDEEIEPIIDRLNLQFSRLTPRIRTDDLGRFRFKSIPHSLVTLEFFHEDSAKVVGSIQSFDQSEGSLDLAKSRTLPFNIQKSPAEFIADPGLMVRGRVVDDQENPVNGACFSFIGTRIYTTDPTGWAEFRVPTSSLQSYQKKRELGVEPTISLFVTSKKDLSFLPSRLNVALSKVEAEQPFKVTLRRGYLVSGIILDDAGEPLDGVRIDPTSEDPGVLGLSNRQGRFHLRLSPDVHKLVFQSSREDLQLASPREAYGDDHAGFLTRTVDLTDRKPFEFDEPIIVARVKPFQISVSLPDGRPAANAELRLRDDPTQESAWATEKSAVVITDVNGTAELMPKGGLSSYAWVDAHLIIGDLGYKSRMKVSDASGQKINMELSQVPILEGRVTVEGNPVAGARLQISESRAVREQIGNVSTIIGNESNMDFVTTDDRGIYRLPVSKQKELSVGLLSLPGESLRPSIGYSAKSGATGIVRVKDWQVLRGRDTILGRVVDQQGLPVEGCRIRFKRQPGITPSLWIGHQANSKFVTDVDGRFELRNVLQGDHTITIEEKSDGRSYAQRTTDATIKTGQPETVISI